jgi:hypothetical protein
VAETSSLLNCRTRKGYRGFESPSLREHLNCSIRCRFIAGLHNPGSDEAFSGCSVARLARLLWEQEVAGSNPATPTQRNAIS